MPVDPCKTVRFDLTPWTTHSVAVLSLESRGSAGRSSSVLARWHVRLTRADLAGHRTDDVVRAILICILHRLDTAGDPADYRAAGGLGVPLGTTGGTVTTDHPVGAVPDPPHLPGL